MLFSDAHLHVNSIRGLGVEKIARKFKEEGGWFIALVALPPYHYGIAELKPDSYKKVLELLTKDASKAREEGLKVATFMGIHPAEIEYYYKQGLKGESAFKLAKEALKVIEQGIRDGLIDGIGEVGRPHYSTSPERAVLAEAVMMDALALARDLGVPIQLHLEQGGFATAYTVRILVDKFNLNPDKVLIHHANTETAIWASMFSLPFTAPIKQFDERYALLKLPYCMIESDFIDDPARPGVSAYPWDIPRVLREHLSKGVLNEEYVYRIMVDNVAKYFGVQPP